MCVGFAYANTSKDYEYVRRVNRVTCLFVTKETQMESQIRHCHPLDFVITKDGLTEYVCRYCCEVFYQYEECK